MPIFCLVEVVEQTLIYTYIYIYIYILYIYYIYILYIYDIYIYTIYIYNIYIYIYIIGWIKLTLTLMASKNPKICIYPIYTE